MERTRIAKVEDVTLARRGDQVVGTLHLTPHHIIFSHKPPPDNTQTQGVSVRPKELWITYPIISFCTYRPSPAASHQPSSLRLRCRDFTFVCFYFANEAKARDVYESIKTFTTKLRSIDKLYAFSYQPPPPEREFNGWELYDPRKEWARQGVGRDSQRWRVSQINLDYGFSPTYPALLPVPSSISDNTLNYAARYRSKDRVPVLTYLHPINNCSITRSSQPMLGFRKNRSIQDEKLLSCIFSTSLSERPLASLTPPRLDHESSGSTQSDMSSSRGDVSSLKNAEELEDEMLKSFQGDVDGKPHIYGAQQHNLIVDARPTVNALAMQAVGLGSENMDNYKFATKAYLGIDNIHVMRESLAKVIDALKESDVTPLGPNPDQLVRSGWLKHITGILEGASLIARQVGLQHSHVLIHCSDGWDRTSQLSALSQICLDPYFRTMEGFMVLVEKDWLSFGHMFRHRSGPLNSEKWFQIENERIGGIGSDPNRGFGETVGAGKAIENAFLSARDFFNRDNNNNSSKDSLAEMDGEMQSYDSENPGVRRPLSTPKATVPEQATKVREVSPVFHQFLDATYQMLYQHPTRFEFNERFLRRLLYHLYSCQFGTFLYNSEKERVDMKAKERTRSVWDYFLARKDQFTNPKYEPLIDDHKRGQERLVFPRLDQVRWWSEAFGRTDEEMNGARPSDSTSRDSSNVRTPVLTGIETAHHSIENVAPENETQNAGSSTGMAAVTSAISNLAFSETRENGQDSNGRYRMEVEMQ